MRVEEIEKEFRSYVKAYDYYEENGMIGQIKCMSLRKEFYEAVKDMLKRIPTRKANRNDDYPVNLLEQVNATVNWNNIDDIRRSIDYVLDNTLTDREAKVIRMRYMDGMTLEECGRQFDVTRERIRQVEAKALRKMRHPSRHKIIEAGMDALEEMSAAKTKLQEATEEYNKVAAELWKKTEAMKRVIDGSKDPEDINMAYNSMSKSDAWNVEVDYLELSVRTYNCVKRAGYRKVGDFVGKKMSDIVRIRNLGRKSAEELLSRLMVYGVEIEDDRK